MRVMADPKIWYFYELRKWKTERLPPNPQSVPEAAVTADVNFMPRTILSGLP